MKVSLKWLNELVKIDDIKVEELTRKISLYSIEIDAISQLSNAKNIVVGYVIDKQKHQSADKLSVCQVDVGEEMLQIICGAPNVAKGQKVVVALEGAILPGDLTIKKSMIRGVESNGMICSLKELGLEKKYTPEEFQDGIYVLDQDAVIGTNAISYLGFDDIVLELGLTPNRSDLLSMRGVANDVAAILNKQVKPLEFNLKETSKHTKDYIRVENLSEGCLTYYAKVVENVKIGPSPNWIISRLIASGIRPINNVVDITNYILMLFGQPLHAFDYAKLGKQIVVRNAFDQEKTVTLDGEKRTLQPSDIAITNGLEVVAIGGVMGCQNTEVTIETTSIVLEAAVFDQKLVRKTSSRLGLRSESSTRFERGVDSNQTELALNYACYLLEKYANASVMKGVVAVGNQHVKDKTIEVSKNYVNSILGINITSNEICDILKRLGFKTSISHDIIQVYVPNRRL
jgi:phenylalanyl-tRNA synthetase beta chain